LVKDSKGYCLVKSLHIGFFGILVQELLQNKKVKKKQILISFFSYPSLRKRFGEVTTSSSF
jgi:hypothetical protein